MAYNMFLIDTQRILDEITESFDEAFIEVEQELKEENLTEKEIEKIYSDNLELYIRDYLVYLFKKDDYNHLSQYIKKHFFFEKNLSEYEVLTALEGAVRKYCKGDYIMDVTFTYNYAVIYTDYSVVVEYI